MSPSTRVHRHQVVLGLLRRPAVRWRPARHCLFAPGAPHTLRHPRLMARDHARTLSVQAAACNAGAGRPSAGGRRTALGSQQVPRARCGIRASWHGTTFARCSFRLQPATLARAARPSAGSDPILVRQRPPFAQAPSPASYAHAASVAQRRRTLDRPAQPLTIRPSTACLTIPSSGQPPASRRLPLMSNYKGFPVCQTRLGFDAIAQRSIKEIGISKTTASSAVR